MKKVLFVCIFLILTLTLTACGESGDDNQKPRKKEQTVQQKIDSPDERGLYWDIVRVNKCQYIAFKQGGYWHFTHAGDCDNPTHNR